MQLTSANRTVQRYRLETLLGKGGMAEVYRATDTKLGRTVAIKMILPGLASQPTFLERFLREARLVATLEHPNILPIYDYGEHEGAPFLVMPYLDGGNLTRRVGLSGLPVDVVGHWVRQLADALDTAHEADILHRDVKSSNVLVGKHDRPILSDFGIARKDGMTSDLTATGAVLGTPMYMAPELASGSPASKSSDLYALAVLAYEMLTGTPPFSGENPLAILHQHVTQPVPAVSERVKGLPAGADVVFSRALAKEPIDRPTTCREFAEQLHDALRCATGSVAGPIDVPARQLLGEILGHEAPTSTQPTPTGDEVPRPVKAKTQTPSRGRARRWGRWLWLGMIVATATALWVGSGSDGGGQARTGATGPVAVPPKTAPGAAVTRVEDPPSATPPPARDLELGELALRLRRPSARNADDFERLLDRVRQGLGAEPDSHLLRALEDYAEGGLRYASGDDAGARASLQSMRSSLAARRRPAPPWLAVASGAASRSSDWELALIFGDARGEGLPRVEDHLRDHPGDTAARLGRARLLHVADRHDEALLEARELSDAAELDPATAEWLPVFLAEELRELGRDAEAVEALETACRAGHRAACRRLSEARPVRR